MKIIEKINQAIEEESLKNPKAREYLYALDVFQCQRKILLEYNKLEATFDAQTLRVFDNGHKVHDRIVRYLELAGYEPEAEINIEKNEHNIHGRLDVKIKDGGIPKLVEIKSIKNFYFLKDGAKEEHIAQLHIYMKYTGIHDGIIIYEAKDTQELKAFEVKFNQELWEKIEKWIKETNELLNANKIPNIPFEYRKENYPCSMCKYQKHCWGGL